MKEPDFYLASSDSYNLEEPRRAWQIARMKIPNRDGALLVRLDPPILVGLTTDAKIELVLLATRLEGASLFPVAEWPVFVYVLRPLIADVESRVELARDEFENFAWAEMYQTEAQARRREM